MAHAYNVSDNVTYNSKCCTVFKQPGKRGIVDTSAGYLIREIKTGTVHDDVVESNLSACNCTTVCNASWPDFTYTGNNIAASAWIMTNLIKPIGHANNLDWGPNADSTQYHFTMEGTTWTKNKA